MLLGLLQTQRHGRSHSSQRRGHSANAAARKLQSEPTEKGRQEAAGGHQSVRSAHNSSQFLRGRRLCDQRHLARAKETAAVEDVRGQHPKAPVY